MQGVFGGHQCCGFPCIPAVCHRVCVHSLYFICFLVSIILGAANWGVDLVEDRSHGLLA
jgi:Na+/melibiose symporter-like transporter